MLAVAHRSGNTVDGMREALDLGVDLVECDVHAYRGVLEVRHHKNLGPRHLWDKWELVRRARFVQFELDELMRALGDDPRLMIDLKGKDRALAPAVAEVLAQHAPAAPFTVCTKEWSALDEFPAPVRPVLSVSNRAQLARLRRRLAAGPVYGVSVRRRLLRPDLVQDMRARTDVVMAWPVDTAAELAEAHRLGVDAVISKDLGLLRRVLVEPR